MDNIDNINQFNRNDRDLLVKLDVKVDQVIQDVKDVKQDVKNVKDDIASRVAHLETEKFDATKAYEWKSLQDENHSDYELRLRRLELWGSMAIGALFVMELLLKYIGK